MKWTEKKVLYFIDLYRKKEVLWDTKHPRHFNKIEKNTAWDELASKLQTTSEECRKKMTALLSSLRREKSKIKKSIESGKGKDEVYQSTWFALKGLQFLWDKNKARGQLSIIPTPDENVEEAIKIEEGVLRDNESPIPPPIVSQKRKRKPEDARLNEAYQLLTTTTTSTKDDEDENQAFCNFIAKKMQKYTAITRSAVEQAVMNVLFNADRGYYDQTPYPSCPTCSQHSQYPQHHHIDQPLDSPSPFEHFIVATPTPSTSFSPPATEPPSVPESTF